MTTISDPFTRSNGGLGSNYTRGLGTSGTLAISSNAVAVTANSSDAYELYTGSSFGNDQEAGITIVSGLAGARYAQLCARGSGQDGTFAAYVVLTNGTSGADNTEIGRVNAGSYTVLKGVSTTFANGNKLGIRVTGSNPVLVEFLKDTGSGYVVIDSFSDSSGSRISSGGTIGVGGYNSGGGPQILDDFTGGDVAAGGVSGDLSASESDSDTLAATGNVGNNGIRLTLRDTDTGALASYLTDVIVSIRAESDSEDLLANTVDETTDENGVLEIASGSIGNVGDYVYVTIEKSDHSIVATYRVQVIDLNA